MMVMRWQLAYPEQVVPFVGDLLGEDGILLPEIYNSLGAMHGTIMIFLGVVPLAICILHRCHGVFNVILVSCQPMDY